MDCARHRRICRIPDALSLRRTHSSRRSSSLAIGTADVMSCSIDPRGIYFAHLRGILVFKVPTRSLCLGCYSLYFLIDGLPDRIKVPALRAGRDPRIHRLQAHQPRAAINERAVLHQRGTRRSRSCWSAASPSPGLSSSSMILITVAALFRLPCARWVRMPQRGAPKYHGRLAGEVAMVVHPGLNPAWLHLAFVSSDFGHARNPIPSPLPRRLAGRLLRRSAGLFGRSTVAYERRLYSQPYAGWAMEWSPRTTTFRVHPHPRVIFACRVTACAEGTAARHHTSALALRLSCSSSWRSKLSCPASPGSSSSLKGCCDGAGLQIRGERRSDEGEYEENALSALCVAFFRSLTVSSALLLYSPRRAQSHRPCC